MIIDSHMHVKNGDVYRTEATGEQIIAAMDKAGIDIGVVFAMCASPADSVQMTYREMQKYPDRLIGYAYARPCYDVVVTDIIKNAFDHYGMRGIKIHRGETLLIPEVIGPVVEVAIKYGYPCVIDSGNDYDSIFALIKAYPELKLILAHLGSPGGDVRAIDRIIEYIKDYPNVYLDTSYTAVYWKIRDAVDRLGASRVIYGSDGVIIDPRTELKKIEVLGFSPEQLELILCKNIAGLIGLDV